MYLIDPVSDPRWSALVDRHPSASVFHRSGWIAALQRTYGFAPLAFTTSAPGHELKNGIVFCGIKSWATGRRLVSLPYSDHCEPLVSDDSERDDLLQAITAHCHSHHYQYAELRPLRPPATSRPALQPSEHFLFHLLDLTPNADELFSRFDRSCIQQRIRRAAKEDLAFEEGRSESQLAAFYHLLVLTRQRHHIPPQPIKWFRNLIASLADAVTIHVVKKNGQPIASILTLAYTHSLVAKYSCSDEAYKKLGATPLLFWKVIQFAKEHGYRTLDLGRCNMQDEGLATFKRRLGAVSSPLSYWQYHVAPQNTRQAASPPNLAKQLLQRMPASLLIQCGRLMYKHFD